jgi:hypothetical protein
MKFTLFIILTVLASAFLPEELFAQRNWKNYGPPKPIIKSRRFYDPHGFKKKNSVRIQVLSITETARLSYERTLGFKWSLGVMGSYQFAQEEAGSTRFDLLAKYFFSPTAPIGFYGFVSAGYASIVNHPFVYGATSGENGEEIIFDPSTNYEITEPGSFSTIMNVIGIGYQGVVGPEKNFLLDFSAGYQHFSMPSKFSQGIVREGMFYGNFDSNQSIFGPASRIQVRVGFGFLF